MAVRASAVGGSIPHLADFSRSTDLAFRAEGEGLRLKDLGISLKILKRPRGKEAHGGVIRFRVVFPWKPIQAR